LKCEAVLGAGTISAYTIMVSSSDKTLAVPYACIVVEFGDAPDALLADCQFRSLT